jgi:hypothetical protein
VGQADGIAYAYVIPAGKHSLSAVLKLQAARLKLFFFFTCPITDAGDTWLQIPYCILSFYTAITININENTR